MLTIIPLDAISALATILSKALRFIQHWSEVVCYEPSGNTYQNNNVYMATQKKQQRCEDDASKLKRCQLRKK